VYTVLSEVREFLGRIEFGGAVLGTDVARGSQLAWSRFIAMCLNWCESRMFICLGGGAEVWRAILPMHLKGPG
jgi:hypothetical protein